MNSESSREYEKNSEIRENLFVRTLSGSVLSGL